MPAGRPQKYSDELAEQMFEIMSTSNRSLKSICDELEIGVTTVFRWLDEKEEFRNKYARAKESQAEFLAEEILQIADTELKTTDVTEYENSEGGGISKTTRDNIQRARLMIDSRKWLASKLKPKKYGDVKSEEETKPEDAETYESFLKKIKEA